MLQLLLLAQAASPLAGAEAIAPAGDPSAQVVGLAGELLLRVLHGDWWIAAAIACSLIVLGLRLVGSKLWPPTWSTPVKMLATAAATFGFAVAGGIFNALGADQVITQELLQRTLLIGAAGSGILAAGEGLLRWWLPHLFAPKDQVIGSRLQGGGPPA